jgi:starch synthase
VRVLFVTPECAPLAKAGGLGDVSAALPPALRALGVEVDALLPAYTSVLHKVGDTQEVARFSELGLDCVLRKKDSLLLLECAPLYQREGSPYQDPGGQDWPDNALRFGLLSKVAARLAADYDVVHCNDWPAALTPVLTPKPTLLTIHNLAFQGNFEPSWLARLGLPHELLSVDQLEFHGRISFLKGGLVRAGAVNTVSATYAREIQSAELGCGLDGVLRARGSALSGILNGIDTEEWNPAGDPHLAQRYDESSLDQKTLNKRALQQRLNLDVTNELPLVGFIGRLTHQKGADLIAAAAAEVAALPAQLALLGRGERELEGALAAAAARHPGRIAVAIGFDEALAHLIEGGADLFLMPSRFEPCGLNQMYSLRYGTLPVVRATGGLYDTVSNYDERTGSGTGFTFEEYAPQALLSTLRWALQTFENRAAWRRMQVAGMRQDFSWDASAREYVRVYERAVRPS